MKISASSLSPVQNPEDRAGAVLALAGEGAPGFYLRRPLVGEALAKRE